MKSVVAWFADNHVAANLLMIFILAAGTITAFGIHSEIVPETDLDKVQVTLVYPGASPEEITESLVRPVEEKIAGIENVRRIDSIAREGLGLVVAEVMYGADVTRLAEDIRAEVARIETLPESAGKPMVRELTQRKQAISVAVYGDVPEAALKHEARRIRDALVTIDGITQARMIGHRRDEIHVEISEETLRKHGLTLAAVADAIAAGSMELPAGSVRSPDGEVMLRASGRRDVADAYRDIPVIARVDGTRINLDHIADIREGYADADLTARFRQQPAVLIHVYRMADQGVLDVAEGVKHYVDRVRPHMPPGVSVDYFQDFSVISGRSIDLLTKNLVIGLFLVGVILALFLNGYLAFWVCVGISVSFAFGFILLPHYAISINMVSLFGLILVIGIVVDDAIIVGENIFRKYEGGMAPLTAAVEGAAEVGRPVLFAILTTMVAFWPLLVAGGTVGNLMRTVAVVVIAVLLGSLIESLLILPAHLRRSRAMMPASDFRPGKISVALRWFVDTCYVRAVKVCLRWRYATLATALSALMIAGGVLSAGIVQYTFFPGVENDVIRCYLTMVPGTPASRTMEAAVKIEASAEAMLQEMELLVPGPDSPLMSHGIAIIGAHIDPLDDDLVRDSEFGDHLATIFIQLGEQKRRGVSSMELVRLWRERAGVVSDAQSMVFSGDFKNMGSPVEVHLSLDDPIRLAEAAQALKKELAGYSGVFDIADNQVPGKSEMRISLLPESAGTGVVHGDLARQVRNGFYGAEALRLQRHQDEVKVLVRYPEDERSDMSSVWSMRIRTASGGTIPFSEAAMVSMGQGYGTIERSGRMQVHKVFANVDETAANANEIRRHLINGFLPGLMDQYPGLRYAMGGEGYEQARVFDALYRNAMIALFGVYVLLAVPFRSFVQPLIVMAAIPFGALGALVGHWLMGFSISFMSLFGMVGLSGVVVNDSLLLIDRINRYRDTGIYSAFDAVVAGSKIRFRAIFLTTITTFAGLTPILLEKSPQAQFLIPMAVSLSFGVLFATLVTLLLVPAMYMVYEDAGRWFSRSGTRE